MSENEIQGVMIKGYQKMIKELESRIEALENELLLYKKGGI